MQCCHYQSTLSACKWSNLNILSVKDKTSGPPWIHVVKCVSIVDVLIYQ